MSEGLRTGQLAELAGVNVQTLRYYERRGLLARPPRRPSGQRAYPEEAVRLVRTIKAAQQLGFTLAEIVELLRLTAHHRGGELRARAAAKLAEVERRLADLKVVRSALRTVLASDCDSLTDCTCDLRPLFLGDQA
ncbi:MAG TPA: MerR family transcriptional regulator [Actinomycetes bacterium]